MIFFSAPLTIRAPPTSTVRKRPKMAPIGVKLWENAFQTIPDISFFDVEKKFFAKILDQKFCCFCRRKMKRRGSSETCFGKVSAKSEPSSGGKRPFKVCIFFRFCHQNLKHRGSSETCFGKVWGRSESCSRGKRPFNFFFRRRKPKKSIFFF